MGEGNERWSREEGGGRGRSELNSLEGAVESSRDRGEVDQVCGERRILIDLERSFDGRPGEEGSDVAKELRKEGERGVSFRKREKR